jgi:4-amino-4-deoxy-L-arabinose transferase-like glycosyltransferase
MKMRQAVSKLGLALLAWAFLSVPAFPADITVKPEIVDKAGKEYLVVRNSGKTTVQTVGLDISFAGGRLLSPFTNIIQPGEAPEFELPLPPLPKPGSYNLTAIVQYLNDGTPCSVVINRLIDNGAPSRLSVDAEIQTESIYLQGKYRVRFKDPALAQTSQLKLPSELVLTEVIQVLPDTWEYRITNCDVNMNNHYTIYLVTERDVETGGGVVHQAGFISRDISTGVYYYHYDKVFVFTIVSAIVAFLLFAAGITAGIVLKKKGKKDVGNGLIFGAIVFLLAFGTFYSGYYLPNSAFWDENYHIASAQKVIDGVMYMEPHPPLGKMFIALGEVLIHPNRNVDTSSFLTTDYIKPFPQDYSFMGMRFFPVVFAILGAVTLFAILCLAIGQPVYAFLFSFLYIFDNALVVHFRGAMLDPIQVFFVLAAILLFFVLTRRKFHALDYLALGGAVGLALAVKVNSAVLVLLLVFMAFLEYKDKVWNGEFRWKDAGGFAGRAALGALGVILPFFFVFYLHGAIGTKVLNNRNYAASDEYMRILQQNDTFNPLNLYVILRDNFKYMDNYQRGVPALDLSKPGENGSPAIGWPVGARVIHYSWNVDENGMASLTIVPNAASWFTALLAVLLSIGLFFSRYVFGLRVKNEKVFWQIMFFAALYIGYMIAVMRIERVMYLYHYFIALMFGFVLVGLVFRYVFEEEIAKHDKVVFASVILLAVLTVGIFAFFSPFTYYQPQSPTEFFRRVWFSFWGLNYVTF